MARDTLSVRPIRLMTVGGMDESVSLTDPSPTIVSANGVFVFFDDMQQRVFGKKIIDYKPDVKVWAVHQSFNGVCLYGYFVETSTKLYFHSCQAPPDLRIKFVAPLQ